MDVLDSQDNSEAKALGANSGSLAEPMTLDEWIQAGKSQGAVVALQAEDELDAHYAELAKLERLIVVFPAFMDGRGFSHGRKLRQAGFSGELLADGDVLKDQWEFLQRCGFSGLLGSAGGGDPDFPGFTVRYQAT
jgi:uncharacterized protein (DUF934 family)